jgi:hypothetical protein
MDKDINLLYPYLNEEKEELSKTSLIHIIDNMFYNIENIEIQASVLRDILNNVCWNDLVKLKSQIETVIKNKK